MILADYLLPEYNISWDYAKSTGINHGVIRLPEDEHFDVTEEEHWKKIYDRFNDFGIKPVIIEPMPNNFHDHIKCGDKLRDESIEKVIKMLPIMNKLDIRTICFNFMAHIGWYRTSSTIKERGNSCVTGFDIDKFVSTDKSITADEVWYNYEYFIKAVIPYAEKYGIKLALHPDDPPVEKLGNVSRIMISYENIKRAINIVKSDSLGVTMCQASYYMMGEDLYKVIPELADKIFFVHFRNAVGNKYNFRESFHDNGDLDMYNILKLYKKSGIDVPIRVDHVPTMAGESTDTPGYAAVGRLYAIGYLKGLLEAIEKEENE